MTLRDELEKKLRGIYVASKNDVFGEIADEVIRQMEWARRGMDICLDCGRIIVFEEDARDGGMWWGPNVNLPGSPTGESRVLCPKRYIPGGTQQHRPSHYQSLAPEDWRP